MNRFEEFVTLTNMVYKGLQKVKSYEVKGLGLKGSHVMCMFYLGQHEEGLTSGELCEKCREDKAAVSRNLKYLVEKGFVKLAEEDDKKYKLKNVLTEEGKEAYAQILQLVYKAEERFGTGMNAKERAAFYKGLRNVAGKFDEFCREIDGM